MVATVLKLRYRVLGNTLARRPWQLVGFILGSLWGLSILGGLVAALIALSIFENLEVATVVAVLGGSALILGWLIGPILIAGLDSTVDAVRLAPFPLTRRQVMLALAGTGLTGIPGIVTTGAALATLIVWVRWPLAAVVAVPTVLLGESSRYLGGGAATTVGATAVGPSVKTLREHPELVDKAAAAGRATYCWTVDDPDDVRLCADLGVSWVATNHPGRTKALLG